MDLMAALQAANEQAREIRAQHAPEPAEKPAQRIVRLSGDIGYTLNDARVRRCRACNKPIERGEPMVTHYGGSHFAANDYYHPEHVERA